MSYHILRKKYPRLSEKLVAIQTLSNMNLIAVDNFKLQEMEDYPGPSNRFVRSCEKWLQKTIEAGLANTEFNILFSNLVLNSDTSDTNAFTRLIKTSNVLQLSKNSFAAIVSDPAKIAEMYNGRDYHGTAIRCFALKNKKTFLETIMIYLN